MGMVPTLHFRSASLAAVFAIAIAACSGDGATAPTPARNVVTLNGNTLTVAIAATNAARSQGLQGVTKMAADSAMLFVFSDARQRAFWMKNTPIPLSIAFLDSTKKVIFMSDMTPYSETVVGGFNAARMQYAIEVNQGWFTAHGVTVGSVASFTLPVGLIIEPDA